MLSYHMSSSPTPEQCPKYDICFAPLCPRDMNTGATWYPTEPICSRKEYATLDWVHNQKKIIKAVRPKDKDTFFTITDLSNIRRVVAGIAGTTEREDILLRSDSTINNEKGTHMAKKSVTAMLEKVVPGFKGKAPAKDKDSLPGKKMSGSTKGRDTVTSVKAKGK